MSTTLPPLLERPREAAPAAPPAAEGRRVLVVARWPVGGIRTHLKYNGPALADAGYRCTFLGPAGESLAVLRDTLGDLPGAEFVGVPVRGRRCRLWPEVRRQLAGGRFSLLHSHGLTAAVHAAVGNLGLGVPHLTTVHDALRPDQFTGLRGRAKRWLLGRVVARIDVAVCVSADIRANLLEYLPAVRRGRCRPVIVCNGIDAGRYRGLPAAADPELRRRLGLGAEVALVGFLGRFMEQKGFLPLLGALQRLLAEGPPRPFHLVAVGSSDYIREYRRQVERRGLAGHVTMLDFVPDVQPLLRQLDLLVVPSLWEASSLVSMEAMAAGVPVLGTDCIGLREVLRDTPSRTVRAGDEAGLCRGLRQALAEPWAAAAQDFAAEACERFDNARAARRLLELYSVLADLRRGRNP
jgi:glycosyltransferase involved in cell wall biosynthesis